MKSILVPTDFSSNSKAGVRFAIQLASQTKCELIFYNVLETSNSNAWIVNNPAGKKAEHSIRQEKLNRFIAAIYKERNAPITKYICVVEPGIDVNAKVVKYSKLNNVDFVCISTRGAGVLRKILGTTTSALIQKCPIPVFVIPKNYQKSKIKEILYSSDMADLKNELATVSRFATSLSAKINVYNYDYMIEDDEIRARLNKVASRYIKKGIDFNFKKQNLDSSISKHLQKDIDKLKPSIVVMFTKLNKAWYERWFLHNNSQEVTFDTKTPLLIFRKTSK
jgi:nucleotide-binding universal stress UspA family protein